ncbi:gamma-glutamyltransferase 1 Threonine peptidase. MEROPS family T03 [Arboricoccus pini]|uniref:Glutathione hydrolase proenzyme n=1 Tax=Arboricoccus pini TaxID=1963835 RepID=A0A212RNC7_9PROT|nr:gamma-glutamyltransferase [Arboricoccus pini]SNB73913.1 gamma-glutamyltransferase 1 Threonine peptidase. MEROPS family T03 [Arboricoccus pini]
MQRRCLAPLAAFTACLVLALPAVAASPAPIAGREGMVVTAQHLASQVGADILRQGGNAVDAAVAVGYALAVVMPAAGNLGGGGFMTLRLPDGQAHFIDFREKAPLAATSGMFLDRAGNLVPGASENSWLAVGVPGTPAGLEYASSHFGSLPRATLMAPAIALARDGFELAPGDVAITSTAASRLARDPSASSLLLDQAGRPRQPGERLVQPALAASLEAIALNGPEAAMYEGPIGKAIVAAARAGGGILSEADFATYKVREFEPITCDYRGYHVIAPPPPSSGGVAICETLNILGGYDLAALGYRSAPEVHFLIEAMRRAYVDRNTQLGDPDFVDNPTSLLLDPLYAAKLRATIDPLRATPSRDLGPATPQHEGSNTTHYSIVDKDGMAVAVTYTLNSWFGIAKIAGSTGIFMNNEMDDFTTKPGTPNAYGLVQGEANAIAPGKTPLSSMSPTIVTKDGTLKLVLGSPGGARIITITLLAILNMVDHGMSVQEAIDAPRLHEQWLPDTVYLEPFALSPDTRAILEQRGHHFTDSAPWGMAEAIVTGAPTLTKASPGNAANSLPLGQAPAAGATLFGAHDSRGSMGRAIGVP